MEESDDYLVESYEISSDGEMEPFILEEKKTIDNRQKTPGRHSYKPPHPESKSLENSSLSHQKEDFSHERETILPNSPTRLKSDKEEFAILESLIFIRDPDETIESEEVWKEWGVRKTVERPISSTEMELFENFIPEENLVTDTKSFDPRASNREEAKKLDSRTNRKRGVLNRVEQSGDSAEPSARKGEKEQDKTQKRKKSLTTELILDSLDLSNKEIEEKPRQRWQRPLESPLAEKVAREVRTEETTHPASQYTSSSPSRKIRDKETEAIEKRTEKNSEKEEWGPSVPETESLELENLEMKAIPESLSLEQKKTRQEKRPIQQEKKKVPESLQSLAFLVQSEKESLENQFHEAFAPYFYTEVCFLEEKKWITQVETLQKLEGIHQKLLFILGKGQNLSRETILHLGVFYFLTHRNYEGIQFIEPLLRVSNSIFSSSEDKSVLYNLLGNFSYRMGMRDGSRSLFLKAIEEDSHLSSAHFSLAYFSIQDQDHSKAYSHLLEAEKRFSESTQFLLLMGRACEFLRKTEEGLHYYEKFLLVSEDTSILLKVAKLTYEKGYHAKALNYFERIQGSTLAEESIPHIEYKKAICYFYTGRKETAMKTMAKWLHFSKIEKPIEQTLLEMFVQAYQQGVYDFFTFEVFQSLAKDLGIRYEKFLEQYIDIKNIHNSLVLFSIAQYFVRRKKYKTSFHYLMKVLKLDRNYFPALRELAKLYYKRGTNQRTNPKKGWEIFSYLLRFGETDAEIDFYLGEYFWERKNFSKAKTFLKNSMEKGYRSFSLYRILGYLSLERKESVEARKYFEEASLLAPKTSIHFRVELGKLYLEAEEYSKSIEMFRKVLQRDPNHKSAHLELAKAYREVLKNESEKHYSKYIHLK